MTGDQKRAQGGRGSPGPSTMGLSPPTRAAGCVVGAVQIQDWKTRIPGGHKHRRERQAVLSHSARHLLAGCWSIDQFEGGVGLPHVPWSGGLQGRWGSRWP